jgi:hypothetical protein
MPVDSLQKQEREPDGHFRKGHSGNPAGRPPGCRNHATEMAEVLLEGEVDALTRKAVELALEGDTTALKLCLELCLDRVVPRRKSQAVTFDLPQIDRVEDLGNAIGSVLKAAAGGRLFLDEAAALIGMMEARRKVMETIDLEKRLQALEAEAAAEDAAP